MCWRCDVLVGENTYFLLNNSQICVHVIYLLFLLSLSGIFLPTHWGCRELFLWSYSLPHAHSVGLLWTRDRPVAETSPWQHTTFLKRDIHAPGGIRTRNPSKLTAEDPQFRPRDHRDRPFAYLNFIYNGLFNHIICSSGSLYFMASFCSRRATAIIGPGAPIVEASRLHSGTPHSVGLLWTSDQDVTEASTWQHTIFARETHSCLRRYSNP